MKQHILLLLSISTFVVSQLSSTDSSNTATASTCPFATPQAYLYSDQDILNPLAALFARQATTTIVSGCQAGFFGCSNLGAPQACCSTTAICTTDSVNHVACCASGATCTGTIGGSSGSTTTQGSGSGGTAVSSNNVVVVTAGSPVNGGAKMETKEGWVLGLLVAILGMVA